jgi:hypothetical protein
MSGPYSGADLGRQIQQTVTAISAVGQIETRLSIETNPVLLSFYALVGMDRLDDKDDRPKIQRKKQSDPFTTARFVTSPSVRKVTFQAV